MADPRHGEVRTRGLKTTITVGGVSAHTYSDNDTWCGHCQRWVPTPGVAGTLRFMAEHRDGDCTGINQWLRGRDA